jgi:tetratricopeptide (TPR) repeat protein
VPSHPHAESRARPGRAGRPRSPLHTLPAALIAAALGLGVAAPQATAQPGKPADNAVEAERLFEQGRKLLDAGRAAEACPHFEKSQQLDPGRGTLINLAACYEAVGRLRDALRVFRDVEEQSAAAGDAPRRAAARKRIAEIDARLPRLVFEVAEPRPPGLEIRIGAEPIPPAQWSDVAVDPGSLEITASAPAHHPFSTRLTVAADGSRSAVEIPALAPVASPGERPAVTVAEDRPGEPAGHRRQRTRTLAGLGIAGGGGLALGISTVIALGAKGDYDDALADHCGGDPNACSPIGYERTSAARRRGNLATVIGGVGVAAIAGGLALWLTAPSEPIEGGHARLVPQVWVDGAGVALSGRF